MYIRLRLVVERLYAWAALRFDRLGQRQNVSVTLRPPDDEEREQGLSYHTVCAARADVEPPRNAAPAFEALWEGRIPPGFDLSTVPEAARAEWKPGCYYGKYDLPLRGLPRSAQDFLLRTNGELWDVTRRVVATACWRGALPCPPYLFRHGRMLWSVDGEEWRMTPVNFVVMGDRPPFLTEELREEIDGLLRRGCVEPLGHELLREAWAQTDLNPRSALVIGISALEAGLKELISELVPDAEWLAKSAPTPPVVSMLK
jgi:hypothetical protein